MPVKVSTQGIFVEVKTGIGANQKPWSALAFKVPDFYQGTDIPMENIQNPNLLFFSFAPNINFHEFVPGHKYNLFCAMSAGAKGLSSHLIGFKQTS